MSLHNPEAITEETCDKIHKGMTQAEVVTCCGREPDSKSEDDDVWFWSGLRHRTDDRDAIVRELLIVGFDKNHLVDTATLAPVMQEWTWFDKVRAWLGIW
jgi:hypothetical protein